MAENKARSNVSKNTKELVIARNFHAPRELVWKAWTDPERVKRWWGPKNFTAPVIKIDFRVGGKYLYCMRSPEVLSELVADPASEKSQRAMKAMLQMKKIDIEGLKKAYEGR